MYWLKDGVLTTCPVIPFYVSGTTFDFSLTLVTESGDDLTGAVLTVADATYAGWVQAKLHSSGTYLNIMGPSNGTCALGDIASSSETVIDFRVNFAEATPDGTKYIAIVLQYGAGITVPIVLAWYGLLWSDSIAATHVSSSQLSVPGDQTTEIRGNQRIKLYQGTDGEAEVTCTARLFNGGPNTTTCTVSPASVTSNLATISRGLTYSEAASGNLCWHDHSSVTSGGPIAALSAFESLEGIMARISDAYTSFSSSTALAVLRRNVANSAYEFALIDLEHLGDTDITSAAKGNILYRNATNQWVNLPVDSDGKVLTLASGLPAWETAGISSDTSSNEGGGVEVALAKSGGNFPFKTFDSSQFEEATTDVINIKSSVLGSSSSINWTGAYNHLSTYNANDAVSDNGGSYICIIPNNPDLPCEPGVTSGWQSKWGVLSQPGAAGSGEANTSSNEGGGLGIAMTKSGVNLPFKTFNTDQFEESVTDVIDIKSSVLGGTGGASPDWCPPAFIYKDADEIYIPVGRYYKGGYRHRGQYQNLTGLASYWDVASVLDVDIDGTYSAGSVSGMIGGAKVISSWYSVFMMGGDANSFLVLPFVRIKAITYSAPNSIINPGDHNTGTSYEDGFLVANDAWNDYRLVKKSFDAYDGNVYTIADSATGTHDALYITGDKTGELVAGEWLQLVPPSDTDCVYLGTVRIDGSGNLLSFQRTSWRTDFSAFIDVTGIKSATAGNTEISAAIPPSARRAIFYLQVESGSSLAKIVEVHLYSGTDATNEIFGMGNGNVTDGNKARYFFGSPQSFVLTAASLIRNKFQIYKDSSWIAADTGTFHFQGFEE